MASNRGGMKLGPPSRKADPWRLSGTLSTRGTPHTRSSQCGHGEDDPEEADLPQSLMEWPSAFGTPSSSLMARRLAPRTRARRPPPHHHPNKCSLRRRQKKCPANLARAEWV